MARAARPVSPLHAGTSFPVHFKYTAHHRHARFLGSEFRQLGLVTMQVCPEWHAQDTDRQAFDIHCCGPRLVHRLLLVIHAQGL
jgi:hypothetical protein